MHLGLKHRPFAHYVLILIVVLILLVVVGITIVDYLNAEQTSRRNQLASEEQTEFYLVNAVRLTDTGLKLFDDSFNQQMKDAFVPFLEEYERSGRDPSQMDLNAVKSRLASQIDLYVIDAEGVIEYTTYPPELGLDFQKTSPEFYQSLNRIRTSEGFFPDRVVQESGIGILRKYAYMPTPDHRYVLELGMASDLFSETRQQLRYSELIAEITQYNPAVENLRIFSPARRQIGNKAFVPDDALNATLDTILLEKTNLEFIDPASGGKTRYLYINLSTDPYGSDTSRIVELTYSNDQIRRTLQDLVFFHLQVALLALVFSSIGAVIISRHLTRPIEGIVRDVDAIAKGDLDHTVSSSPAHEFRVLEESTNTMVRTLKETISKLQESESHLTASEERYRVTSDLISDYAYCVAVDSGGVSSLVWATGAFERILDFPREKLLAQGGVESVVYPDDLEVYGRHLTLLFKDQPHRSEFRIITRSGETRWLSHRTLPVWDVTADRLVQYYAAGQDITREKEAEAENRRLNEELEQRVIERTSQLEAVNRDLESFSYSVSHDLRSPLRAIDGYAFILKDTYGPALPEEAQRYLQVIRESAQRMDSLINDLLRFSRIGRQALDKQRVSPADLVQSSLEELKEEMEGRDVEVRVEEMPDCLADPTLLRQVFVNLLSNALKFTRDRWPAEVTVGSFVDNGQVVYYVRDNGVGFDMQYAGSLFGVFRQLSHKERYQGSGVGLAIVKRIVERHGGTIWTRSAVDKGATFYFTLNGGGMHE
jgi:PAS domain S-box-containing protein